MNVDNQVMKEMLGDNHGVVDCMFCHMDIAEEEITRGKLHYPTKFKIINDSFMLLVTPAVLKGKCDEAYRAHVREIIERVALGQDTRPGTTAECLCHMMEVALKAPLTGGGQAITERLFDTVFPGKFEITTKEHWPGQVDDDVLAMRKKLRDDERLLEKVK